MSPLTENQNGYHVRGFPYQQHSGHDMKTSAFKRKESYKINNNGLTLFAMKTETEN